MTRGSSNKCYFEHRDSTANFLSKFVHSEWELSRVFVIRKLFGSISNGPNRIVVSIVLQWNNCSKWYTVLVYATLLLRMHFKSHSPAPFSSLCHSHSCHSFSIVLMSQMLAIIHPIEAYYSYVWHTTVKYCSIFALLCYCVCVCVLLQCNTDLSRLSVVLRKIRKRTDEEMNNKTNQIWEHSFE